MDEYIICPICGEVIYVDNLRFQYDKIFYSSFIKYLNCYKCDNLLIHIYEKNIYYNDVLMSDSSEIYVYDDKAGKVIQCEGYEVNTEYHYLKPIFD